jgi:hypothetical protein
VHAGNEDSFFYGDQAALSGGAVVATSRNTASIWYNPAGLGLNDRDHFDLSGTAFTVRYRAIPDGLALDLPAGPVDTTLVSRKVYAVPAALAYARKVGDGISLGLGLFVTEQDLFNYKANVTTGDNAIALDVSGALSGTLIRYHGGPAIGIEVSPRVRVGASLFGLYEDYRELRKLFANATSNGPYETTFFQRLVDARAWRLGIEAVGGIQVDAGCGWELGLAIRSPRLVFEEVANTDNSTVLVSKGETVTTIADSTVDHTPIGVEGTGFTRPARLVVGFARRYAALEGSAELDVRLSGIGATAAHAVWNARSGVVWNAGTRSVLGLGVFTDRSGAAAPVTFPDFRVDYYGVSAGWKRHNSVRLQTGEAASTLRFSTTLAVRYALGFGDATRIRFDFTNTPATGLVGRVADERESVVFHELSLYVGSGFEF